MSLSVSKRINYLSCHGIAIFYCICAEDDGSLISELSSAKHSVSSPQDSEPKNEPTQVNAKHGSIPLVAELETSTETTYSGQRLMELFILLCCENALWLYSLNSVIQVPLTISIYFSFIIYMSPSASK